MANLYNVYGLDGELLIKNARRTEVERALGIPSTNIKKYAESEYVLWEKYKIEIAQSPIPDSVKRIFDENTYFEWIKICSFLNPGYGVKR